MEECVVIEIFFKMLLAVDHLHKNGIIHRDIKLENFFVGDTVDEVKLIDFGLAIKMDDREN